MVAYVRPAASGELFDPAAGAGAFFAACRHEFQNGVAFRGCDIDLSCLKWARTAGLEDQDLTAIEQRNFVLDPPPGKFSSIVANPPYIRHHRLPSHVKQELRLLSRALIGQDLDGRAGLHVYFLLRALQLLALHGRLAFIIPGDTFEGVFSNILWSWVTKKYTLDAIITFSGAATPFPGVDTNAVIALIRNDGPTSRFAWARCTVPETQALSKWVKQNFRGAFPGEDSIRAIEEALATGLSRPASPVHDGPTLVDFARVVRGIATGDNEFFFLNSKQISELGLDSGYFVRAVARTRDVNGDRISQDDIKTLDADGRPTYLLSLGAQPTEALPETLRRYLETGQRKGLCDRPLIAGRKPWYRMEKRAVPSLLFAYLGRRNTRFILNQAGVVPLTGFLCVYPNPGVDAENLWKVLNHPDVLARLRLVAKSYGSDAIKVEPRALERLAIPERIAKEFGLQRQITSQEKLAFAHV